MRPTHLLDRTSDVVNRALEIASAALIATIIALVLVSIAMRNLNVQFIGAYEYTRVAFLWASFFGIAVAYRRKAHVCVNVLHDALPRWCRRAFGAISGLTALAFFGVVGYAGIGLIDIVASQRMPSTGLSARWLYVPVLVSFAAMALHTVTELVKVHDLDTLWRAPGPIPESEARSLGRG